MRWRRRVLEYTWGLAILLTAAVVIAVIVLLSAAAAVMALSNLTRWLW